MPTKKDISPASAELTSSKVKTTPKVKATRPSKAVNKPKVPAPEPDVPEKAAGCPTNAAVPPDTSPSSDNPPVATQGKNTIPGVRPTRTRPYLAGAIVAKHGLAAGVTPAMVGELDKAYGKPNPRESQFCLKNAWHACRAYSGVAEDAVE